RRDRVDLAAAAATAAAGAAQGGQGGGVGGLGLVVLVVHGGRAPAGEGPWDPGIGVADAPLRHPDAAGDLQAVAHHGGVVGGLLVQVRGSGRQLDAVIELGYRDVDAQGGEPLHVGQHRGGHLAQDEVALKAHAVDWHSLGEQRLHQAVHGVALGVLALDAVIVDVQLRAGVGGVRGAQRVGDVPAAHRPVEHVADVAAVAVERFVDDVPGVNLALVVADLRGDVAFHRLLDLVQRQAGHPRRKLPLPDQVVPAYPHAVRLGEGHDRVARGKVVGPVGRLGCVPLHLV